MGTFAIRPPNEADVATLDRASAPAAADDVADAQRTQRRVVHLSELVVGGLVVAVALLAWIALALAHLGWFSLGAALGVWGAVLVIVVGACWRWAPVSVHVDRAGCLGTVGLAIVAGVMLFPGFHYGVTDKDPGGYVEHAMSIARTGSYDLVDPTLNGRIPGGPIYSSPGARFAGVWQRDAHSDVVVPTFYHLWPSLMAVADAADGEQGLSNTAPLVGVLAILAAALALRRAAAAAPWGGERLGLVSGGIGGLLLATNMLEVWQAKYPSSEISAQMLFTGALMCLVVALSSGWAPAAGASGLLLGVSFLDRADGVLLVGMAVAVIAGVIALRRWDSRTTWFAAGLAIVMPHALWQAYSYDAAGSYSRANHVPSLPRLALVVAALLIAGLLLRPVGPRVAAWVARRRTQLIAGLAITAAAALLLTLGFLRPRLFGASYDDFRGVRGRSFDEQIMARLSWFISTPGFFLMLLGIAVVAIRRWSLGLWVITTPLLVFFPIYGYRTHNSTRLMWWTRRFMPTVAPLILLLIALALGIGLTVVIRRAPGWRGWLGGKRVWALRVTAAAALVGLFAFFINESWPLRKHQEFAGSFQISARMAADAGGKQGVYLFQRTAQCCITPAALFGSAMWLERGQVSSLLPQNPQQMATYVAAFVKAFPGQPVFLVFASGDRPPLPGFRLTQADHIVAALPYWEENDLHRPRAQTALPVDFMLYRVESP